MADYYHFLRKNYVDGKNISASDWKQIYLNTIRNSFWQHLNSQIPKFSEEQKNAGIKRYDAAAAKIAMELKQIEQKSPVLTSAPPISQSQFDEIDDEPIEIVSNSDQNVKIGSGSRKFSWGVIAPGLGIVVTVFDFIKPIFDYEIVFFLIGIVGFAIFMIAPLFPRFTLSKENISAGRIITGTMSTIGGVLFLVYNFVVPAYADQDNVSIIGTAIPAVGEFQRQIFASLEKIEIKIDKVADKTDVIESVTKDIERKVKDVQQGVDESGIVIAKIEKTVDLIDRNNLMVVSNISAFQIPGRDATTYLEFSPLKDHDEYEIAEGKFDIVLLNGETGTRDFSVTTLTPGQGFSESFETATLPVSVRFCIIYTIKSSGKKVYDVRFSDEYKSEKIGADTYHTFSPLVPALVAFEPGMTCS